MDVYVVIVTDPTSELSPWSLIYDESGRKVYRSIDSAKKGVQEAAASYPSFLPVAYGVAYPFEQTSFESELQQKGFAVFGWGVTADDEGDEVRTAISVLRLSVV
jgi:hypothetical protein